MNPTYRPFEYPQPPGPTPKPKLFIATPIGSNEVKVRYDASQSGTERRLQKDNIPYYWVFQTGAEPCRARNYLVAQFLAKPEFTHICFIDSDQGWPEDTIPKLLGHGVDVIGVPILKKIDEEWTKSKLTDDQGRALFFAKNEPQWNFYSQEPALWDGRKMQLLGPLSYIGTGIMLISRECLVRMIEHYPELRITVEYSGVENTAQPHFAALFQRTVVNGEYAGEDVTFCRRWLAMGGEVYADPTIQTCHVGQREWIGRFADVMTFEDEAEPAKPELVGAVA